MTNGECCCGREPANQVAIGGIVGHNVRARHGPLQDIKLPIMHHHDDDACDTLDCKRDDSAHALWRRSVKLHGLRTTASSERRNAHNRQTFIAKFSAVSRNCTLKPYFVTYHREVRVERELGTIPIAIKILEP